MTTRSPVAIYAERTRDERHYHAIHGWTLLEGRVLLRDFQAMDNATRCATWQAMTDDDQRGLVLQILRLKGRELTAARITGWLAVMGERFGGARGWGRETSTGRDQLVPSLQPLAPQYQEVTP